MEEGPDVKEFDFNCAAKIWCEKKECTFSAKEKVTLVDKTLYFFFNYFRLYYVYFCLVAFSNKKNSIYLLF